MTALSPLPCRAARTLIRRMTSSSSVTVVRIFFITRIIASRCEDDRGRLDCLLFGQAPVFSQRYRVLTYDRRGTGRSASPPGRWTAADLANDLARFLDALGIDRAIAAGSSLGGVVTAQFAVDNPGRALALVIGHTVPYLDDAGRDWLEAEIARAIAVLRDWDQRPRRGDLAKIDVPTLVIVGEREPRTTIDGACEWASWIPGAEFVMLHGAHHAAPREAAPAWNAAVQDFLDRHGL